VTCCLTKERVLVVFCERGARRKDRRAGEGQKLEAENPLAHKDGITESAACRFSSLIFSFFLAFSFLLSRSFLSRGAGFIILLLFFSLLPVYFTILLVFFPKVTFFSRSSARRNDKNDE